MKKLAVINYGMGNLHSVMKGLARVKVPAVLTDKPAAIKKSCGIILPGVGAFGDAMREIRKRKLLKLLKSEAAAGKPVLGICLGMQLLLAESSEFGRHRGFGFIKGKVVRFGKKAGVKVPHMGWNNAVPVKRSGILRGVRKDALYYFVHSYHAVPADKRAALTLTDYGGKKFASSVEQGNVYGFQFHPEKSGEKALKIYSNFYKICNNK